MYIRYNVKRRLMNQPPASEDQFDGLVEHQDVSSISGSDSEDEDEGDEDGASVAPAGVRRRRGLVPLPEDDGGADGDEGGAGISGRQGATLPDGQRQMPQFVFKTAGVRSRFTLAFTSGFTSGIPSSCCPP